MNKSEQLLALQERIRVMRNKQQPTPTTKAPPLPKPVVKETLTKPALNSTYISDFATLYQEDSYNIRTNCDAEPCSFLFKQYMKQLFSSGENHDVTLVFGADTIQAHKKILSVRSEYFKTMFEGKMAESQQQSVQIDEEQEYKPMRAFLQYLYCEYIDLSECNMLELLHAVSKYAPENERLSQIIIHNIYTTLLKMSTIEQVHTYAKENEIPALITACEDYIYLHGLRHLEAYREIYLEKERYSYTTTKWNHNIYLIGNCSEKPMIFNYLKMQMVDLESNDASGEFSFTCEANEQIVQYTVTNTSNAGVLERPKSKTSTISFIDSDDDEDTRPASKMQKRVPFKGANVVCFDYNDAMSFNVASIIVRGTGDYSTLLLIGVYSSELPPNEVEQAERLASRFACKLINIRVGDTLALDQLTDHLIKVSSRVEQHISTQQQILDRENQPRCRDVRMCK